MADDLPPPSTSPAVSSDAAPSTPEAQLDPIQKAEKVKEQGNTAFKGGRYQEAIDLYSEAISECP